MNPKYMLDTNICIYLMKHQPPEVRERFAQCFVGDVVISAVTLVELCIILFSNKHGMVLKVVTLVWLKSLMKEILLVKTQDWLESMHIIVLKHIQVKIT